MNWTNVKWILFREVRDQLRDRRTLFMIAVLPILLYPLLGMSLFQMAQFVREQPTKVLVLGAEKLADSPALIEGDRFAGPLFSDADRAQLLELQFDAPSLAGLREEELLSAVRRKVAEGEFAAVVYFPDDFTRRLESFRESLRGRVSAPPGEQTPGAPTETAADNHPIDQHQVPGPEIFYNTAREKSQLAYVRVSQVLDRWTEEIGRQNLATSKLPETVARPFELAEHDMADRKLRDAAIWAKVLPFLLLIWALTGAFYPAVDLCAGEKERGTLETLLSSPAERTEIVWGKLLTIMLFSMATAVLNILSLGITGSIVMSQFPQFGPPPLMAPVWLLIALVPMSAMFSALCLALAAFARSSKEGQYYLMPLVLITMPLVILPMAPGVELSLGNSLIPVTGVVLLLRAMMEGNYLEALPFVAPVTAVTLGCCLLAMRWAVDQFNTENVLFRESERLDVGLWLRHLLRDRADTPPVAAAVFCGVLILLLRFFMGFALPQPNSFGDLATLSVITQLVVILTPALLMTVFLTRSPVQTLLLRRPPLPALPAAVLLAVLVHPAVCRINELVQYLYPVSEEVEGMFANLMSQVPSIGWLLLLMAAVPAVCEELAFRGFILSGFRHLGHKWRAIALSSLFFGVSHGIFQQSLVACLVGALVGYLAVQTGSLLPGILYHFVHNSLALLSTQITPAVVREFPLLDWVVLVSPESFEYRWPAVFAGMLASAGILYWLSNLEYSRTEEEALQEAIEKPGLRVPAR